MVYVFEIKVAWRVQLLKDIVGIENGLNYAFGIKVLWRVQLLKDV